MLKAANSVVPGTIMPNFIYIQDIVIVFVTFKKKRNAIKIECAREVTTLDIDFSEDQGQLTLTPVMGSSRNSSKGSSRNSNSSKCLLLSLIPARMRKDPLKNEVS